MSHGGAREGSGRKPKTRYPGRAIRVSRAVQDHHIEEIVRYTEDLEIAGYDTGSMSTKAIIELWTEIYSNH